jgi:hypothetical protein
MHESPQTDLDGEQRSILAALVALQGHDLFPGQAPERALQAGHVQVRIQIERRHPDQLVAGVAQVLTGLTVDVQYGEVLGVEKKGVGSVVDQGAEA